ncbi:glycosyltransferase [Candidatus Neomarinimicrobiota bacterium]
MTLKKKVVSKNPNPVKILFFIESLYQGGRERQLVELLKQLTKKPDFQCELVTMRKDIFYKEIIDLGIKIRIVERKFIKKDPIVFFKFYNIAKRFKPDIVHVWGNMTATYSLFAKMLLDFKLVNFQIQDAPPNQNSNLINHKMTFCFSDLIIANSNAGIEAYGAPLNKCEVIYNGFDFIRINNLKNKSDIRNRLGINTRYTVAMIARFSKHKDYATYIRAANIILSNRYDVTFLCIGYGNSEIYIDLVNQQNIGKIKFFTQQNDIESIMNICDIGLLMTDPKYHGEGIPNVLMEFMALEKPVIASGGGGTKELIIDGESGFLIPTKSPKLLAEKIQYLLDNSLIAEKLGTNGYNRIKQKFNIEKMVNNFVRIYHGFTNA